MLPFRVDADIFENALRVEEDLIFTGMNEDAFSKISRYVWT